MQPALCLILLLLVLAPCQALADVVLLLSDSKPSVTVVAREFAAQYKGKIETYNLNADRGKVAGIVSAIRGLEQRQVVAIGLLAAQTARKYLSSKQVVFCQVLTPDEFDLFTPWMTGVGAIPPPGPQFRAWKQLNPNLQRIGVIASDNLSGLLQEAQLAARHNGLELIVVEAASDREVMPALNRLAGKIQGLWLVPDSRVLSHGVILRTLSLSIKQNIQVLAFSPALLKEGALLSGTQDPGEIARLVIHSLNQPEAAQQAGLVPLSSVKLNANAKAAERFGLQIPRAVREVADVE